MAATSALAVTEIQWWHAMGGALGEKLTAIAEGFNQSQSEYKVVPVYKGTYAETMTAGIAAFRSKQPPHILQVFEVGTATMMAAKGAIKPVYELMAETGEPFDPKAYLSAVTGYYSTTDGKMLSMPFNSSTPILYYNKDGFKKAGLDPETPPKTWPEVEEYAKKLVAAGFQCGFSSSWTSWIHMENFSAWHNQPVGTKANGFQGLDTEFVFNTPLLVKHVQQLADWQKDKIFAYGGRTNKGSSKFSSGECAMYTESSAGYAGFKSTAKFEFGTGMLPYWPDAPGAPQNTIIGGASLWVMTGLPAEDYKGVAKFFSYLSSPEVQADWHQFSGYLPITTAAYELTKKAGFYEQKPGTETPILQMTLHAPNENSMGIRFGNFPQMRDIMDDEFEAIFAGKKTAEQGMADAVKAGNELLRKFEAANK
ncbi:extracellular solute-binding protein, family 1 [Candidatus Moduliflexus flocculans]|uniref:Extracellular solute-binding protein, family 1 n=1 Tax=Candidatus Moduliflexus flocculans TaxID=1499966 RepID=A0A081BT94_9BACT|nr:extracellular solute-binding protein, family 1 [Candidatus Moduliflexus flocculans]